MKKWLVLALGLYLVSSASSFAAFSVMGRGPIPLTNQNRQLADAPDGEEVIDDGIEYLLDIDPNEPVDQPCPLNGQLYTNTERQAWEQRRPLAVMIENAPDARPQSGLGQADIVFEAVAEGGVTRFMAMYLCEAQKQDLTLAPVRSARTYFVDLAAGFNRPLYVHVGGSNVPSSDYKTDALGYLSYLGWTAENDLNQFSIGFPTFVRNYNRIEGKDLATEHTMESTTEGLWEVAAERGWTNTEPDRVVRGETVEGENWYDVFEPWTFQTEPAEIGSVTNISHDFWSGYDQYVVEWTYNPDTNAYKRDMGGEPHIDLNTGQQIEANTVIVFLTTERGPVNEKKHMIYKTEGTGDALIFQNGQAIEATWARRDNEDMYRFTDARGEDVALSPGLIWMAVVDESTEVAY